MVDKTPLYVNKLHFESVLGKTPNVPVIVTQKRYEKLGESWSKRNDTITPRMYNETFNNVWLMKKKFPNRILIIQEEDLMTYPERIMLDVFQIGMEV